MDSRETGGESQAFVLRVRLDPRPGVARAAALRIRLERVADRRVWHFDAIDPLIAELRSCLDTIVRQSPI